MPHHYFGASIILLDESPDKLISMEGLHGGHSIDKTEHFMSKSKFLALAYDLVRENETHMHYKDWSPVFKNILESTSPGYAFTLFLTLFCNGISFDKEDLRFAASIALCTDIQLVEISGNNGAALQLTCDTWETGGRAFFEEWTTAFEGAQVIHVKQNGGVVAGLKKYRIPCVTLDEFEEVQIKPSMKNAAYFFAPASTLEELVATAVKRKEGESIEETEARRASKIQRIMKELNDED